MKKSLIVSAFVLFLSCYAENPSDPNHVSLESLRVKEIKSAAGISLDISGTIYHDPFGGADRKIEIKNEDGCEVILVKSKQSPKNAAFSFDYEYAVSPYVDKVCFGDPKYVIWDRAIGVVEIKYSYFRDGNIRNVLRESAKILIAIVFGVFVAIFIKRKIIAALAFFGLLLLFNFNASAPYFGDDPNTWWHTYFNGLLQIGSGLLVIYILPAWLAYLLVLKYGHKLKRN